jgi:RimJ/RimL family protein N-acetyltransferase
MTVADSKATLKDGTTVQIRPIRPDDDHVLVEAFRRLSPESVYQRFFTALPELSPGMARYLAHVNYTNRLALLAEIDGELAAVARYERTRSEAGSDSETVELGLVVLDQWQNRGLGRIMLRAILDAAERNGIHRFRADVLAENRRMLRLLATEATVYDRKTEAGVTTLFLHMKR